MGSPMCPVFAALLPNSPGCQEEGCVFWQHLDWMDEGECDCALVEAMISLAEMDLTPLLRP